MARRGGKAPGEVLTLKEAAQFLRVSEISLRRLAIRRAGPGRKGHKVGRLWRFLKSELEEWLRGH